MKVKLIPLDYDYFEFNSESVVRVWGRTSEGKRCCILDSSEAFFWVIPKRGVKLDKFMEKLKDIRLENEKGIKNLQNMRKSYLGKEYEALKVTAAPKEISSLAEAVKMLPESLHVLEIDINFITRYIIERGF